MGPIRYESAFEFARYYVVDNTSKAVTTRIELRNQVWEINGFTKFQIHSAITPAN
jgi:hypothetical protein